MHDNKLRYTLFYMSTYTLIDSHCHLDFESFDNDREQVLQRAQINNIESIVIPGTKKSHWDRINKLCVQHKQLHPCFGLHPYWVDQHEKQDIAQLNNYVENNSPIAIGECGLDFRNDQADKKTQLFFFEAQLEIAQVHQLPVVIHSVKATETVIQSIKKFENLKGMVHSYSGSLEQAIQLIELDFFISIGGSVTYENAKKIKTVAKEIPLTSLLLETDSPDQADQQNANKRNEPAFLINTLDCISKLKNMPRELIAEQTTQNAKKLFSI